MKWVQKRKDQQLNKTIILLLGGGILLCLAIILGLMLGNTYISFQTVLTSFFQPDLTNLSHQIILDIRAPRIIATVLVGAALAVSGALMQGITANPLADSGVLGINAGASLALAVCLAFFPAVSYLGLLAVCFLGAGVSVLLLQVIQTSTRGTFSGVKVILAGMSISIFMVTLSQTIGIIFHLSQDMTYWLVGGVANVGWEQVFFIMPWVIGGLLVAIIISRQITMLNLDDQSATSIGAPVKTIRTAGILVTLILTGAAVSLIGSIGFVGILVPHFMRFLVGSDYRKIIPLSIVGGGLFLVIADIVSRTINPPSEVALGAIISLLGVPFFFYIIKKMR